MKNKLLLNYKKTVVKNNSNNTTRFNGILALFLVVMFGGNMMGQNLTQSGFTGVIVPQYMGSFTNNRLPVIFRATVSGLTASTSYRYYINAATNSTAGGGNVDFGTTNSGAGNPVLLNTAGTSYSTTGTGALGTAGSYETFTTDASGNYTGWFGFVNTGNGRFTAGNTVYPSITISTGGSSSTVGSRKALDLGITVFAYSTSAGATNGSFVNSSSSGTPKNLVALYNNVTGTGRPIYVTYIESTGITNTTTGFTTYSTSPGNWGALIPNALTNGVRRIEQFSSSTGNAVNDNQDADGTWTTGSVNTTTSTNGLTAKTISGTDAPLNVATTVVLSSPNPAVSAATLTASSTNNPIYRFDLAATNANATLSSLFVTTTGSYVSADVSNMKLWYQSSSTFNSATATLLSTISTPGTAGSKTFSTFTRQVVTSGSTGYFFITVDIASSITSLGSTLGISAVTTSNIGLTSSTSFTGSTNAGGTQTIGYSSNTNINLLNTGTPSSANLGTGSGKLIYGFSLTPSGGSVNFTALNVTTSGSALASDISAFDLYYDADASGTINAGDVLVKTVSTLANPLAFSAFTGAQNGLADGTTYRYLVQAIVAGSPTNGRTITLSIASTGDITTNATGSVSGTPSGNVMYVGNPSSATDNSGTPSASNVTKGATDFVVFGFQVTPTGLVDFTAVNITTSGTATSSDLSNFRLYKDANSNGVYDNGTDVLVQTVSTLSSSLSFSSLAQTSLTAATKYLVIANIASGATTGRTFTASIAANGDITLTSGLNTGTAAGNQMTVDAGTFGDFRSNGIGGGVWSSTITWQTYSATGTWVAASVAPTSTTYVTKDVTILSGDQVTVTGTSNYCKNLMVQGSGGKLLSNQVATTTFINVYGDITCNGTIGNGSAYDAIGFDVEGSSCTISGSGTFDAARIAKNSITSPAATTTTLTFDMNANLRYGGTGSGLQSTNNTELYNNIAGSIFNIVINQNKTLTCLGDGTTNAAAAISIDGTDGTGSGERGGSLTVNGTLDIQYNGTPAGTSPTYGIYLTTNNATSAVSVSIGASGIINTPRIVCSASGLAGHTFSIASGGTLNITNEPASFITPSNTNNNFTFDANSNINYTKTGAQTLYAFGSSVYQGNITLSGSGVKSVSSTAILNINGVLTTGGLLTLKSNASGTASVGTITTGTITGNVTVERYIPNTRAWRALTAPVTGSANNNVFYNWQNNGNPSTGTGVELWGPGGTGFSGNGLTTGPNSSLLKYNNTGTSVAWNAVTNSKTTELFDSAINNAFMVFVTGPYAQTSTNITNTNADFTTLKATGQLIVGTKNYLSLPSGVHTLIGNPYASPISPLLLLNGNASFGSTLWIWDAKAAGTYGVGAYNTYDKAANKYTNIINNAQLSTTPDIQSGQAFFVKASSGTATLAITESFKSSAATVTTVFRNEAPPELLRLGLYKQINNEWSGRDGAMTVILADANANQAPNKMDNGSENIVFTKNGGNFASNHHLPLVATDVLNVKVWNTTAGANYKLKINTEDFETPNLDATLEDLFTNARTPLALDGTAVEYPFTVTTDALSTGDRFKIVFQSSTLGTNNPKANGFSIVPNPVTGDVFQVNLGALATGTYTYSICNAIGQEVEKGSINNAAQNTNYEVKMSNSATGIYLMKIKGSDNSVFTAKIIKK